MIDKVAEEIKQGQIQDPDKWNRIRSEADKLTNHYRDVIEKKRVSGDRILHFAFSALIDPVLFFSCAGTFEIRGGCRGVNMYLHYHTLQYSMIS